MLGKKPSSTPWKKSRCSLPHTDRHENSDRRSHKRDINKTRRLRPGQQNSRHNNNRSVYANTATTPTSTTQTEAHVPVKHVPSTTAAATTAATSTSFATPPYPFSPPIGIGYFFIAAPLINIVAQPVEFSMTADQRSGAFRHFIDNQPLPGIKLKMNHALRIAGPSCNNQCSEKASLHVVGQGWWSFKCLTM